MSAIIEFHLVKYMGFKALAQQYFAQGDTHNAYAAELKALQNLHRAERLGVRTDETTVTAYQPATNAQLSIF